MKEVYNGWLIKSPPTKRIWRARWRRRWFTLRESDIPGQFCLEYYTDRNCRKLKGVIDLDQCEQVDSGLRLEHRKQKFQHMFDIKTPRRIYYLAADSENDMRDWVNCICQVCNLHDFTKEPGERQYYNIREKDAPEPPSVVASPQLTSSADISINSTNSTTLNSSTISHQPSVQNQGQKSSPAAFAAAAASAIPDILKRTEDIAISQSYPMHNNDLTYVNTEYSNRETLLCDDKLALRPKSMLQQQQPPPVERSQSVKNSPVFQDRRSICPNHSRAQSLSEAQHQVPTKSTGKKIPENLVLSNHSLGDSSGSVVPSPALSTCSGPYIPISECFSGSPKFLTNNENPATPLNSLDPKFYDTPRKHNNIGLNLTASDQSYSPKIYNCPQQQHQQHQLQRPKSGRSSPTDSESVFTDDEEWSHPLALRESLDRNLRPSDSSVENENIIFTYTQRFSKMPDDNCKAGETNNGQTSDMNSSEPIAFTKSSENRLMLESKYEDEKNREYPQFSDTENSSPAIGPKESSSCVEEESYDIPRSHHLPYCNMSHQLNKSNNNGSSSSLSPNLSTTKDVFATSTPNLIAGGLTAEQMISPGLPTPSSSSKTLPRPHFYTNAAPKRMMEGNVFRYDFIEQSDAPAVNRSLKPKLSTEDHHKTLSITTDAAPAYKPPAPLTTPANNILVEKSQMPPSVDRKLKPGAKDLDIPSRNSANTVRRRTAQNSLVLPHDMEFTINHKDLETRTLPRNMHHQQQQLSSPGIMSLSSGNNNFGRGSSNNNSTLAAAKSHSALQYFDLDVANPPPQIITHRTIYSNSSNTPGKNVSNHANAVAASKLNNSIDSAGATSSVSSSVKNSVVYNSVDFVKTEAFKRIREDAEKNRMKD